MPVAMDLNMLLAVDTSRSLGTLMKDDVLAAYFYEFAVRSFCKNEVDYWVGLTAVCEGLKLPAPACLRDRLAFKGPKLANAKYPRCAWLYEEYVSARDGRIAPQQINIDGTSRDLCDLAYDEPAGADGLAAPNLGPAALALTATQLSISLDGLAGNWKNEIRQLLREAKASLESLETNELAPQLMALHEKQEQNLGSLRGGRFFLYGPMIDTRLLMLVTHGDRGPLAEDAGLAKRCLLKSAPKRAVQGMWAAATERGKKLFLVYAGAEGVRAFQAAVAQTKLKGTPVQAVPKEDVNAQFLDKDHWERKTRRIHNEIEAGLDEMAAAAPVASLLTLAAKSAGYETVAEALKAAKRMLPKVGGEKLAPALDQFISKHTKGSLGSTAKDKLVKLEKKAGTGFWCVLYRRVSGSELKPEVWLFRGSSILGLVEPGRPDKDCWLLLAK